MRRHLAATLLAMIALASPLSALAATFLVTNTANSGAGSLRQALIDAGSDGTFPRIVRFAAAFPTGGTITLGSSLPTWSNNILTIDGNDRAPVIDGGNSVRIFSVDAGTNQITLRGLTFRNGRSSAGVGGCLHHVSTTARTDLYVEDSRFEGCRAVGNQINAYGGAINWVSPGSVIRISDSVFSANGAGVIGNASLKEMIGGAILLSGDRLAISMSRFSDNAVERVGGKVQGLGGAAYLSATDRIQLRSVEWESNAVIDADGDGAISAGGALVAVCQSSACSLDFSETSFIDNSVSGIDVGGGALATQGGAMLLLNASFNDNRAAQGAGGALLALPPGELDVRHASFKDNQAVFGAHLALSGVDVSAWGWSLFGPVAAGSGDPCDFDSVTLSGGTFFNMFEAACGLLSVQSATIGPVGNLSLDTTVFPAALKPGAGSPAIDPALPQVLCGIQDIRGVARPLDGNDDGTPDCDVGAYEVPPQPLFADGFDPD